MRIIPTVVEHKMEKLYSFITPSTYKEHSAIPHLWQLYKFMTIVIEHYNGVYYKICAKLTEKSIPRHWPTNVHLEE